MDTSFDTPIMFVMYRPALLILISPISSYLPHGSSEGCSSEIIRLSIMWLNSLNTSVQVSFKPDPFVTLRKCTRSSTRLVHPNLSQVVSLYSSRSDCVIFFLLKSPLANWSDWLLAKQLGGKATTILSESHVRIDWKLLFRSPRYNRSKSILIEP